MFGTGTRHTEERQCQEAKDGTSPGTGEGSDHGQVSVDLPREVPEVQQVLQHS